MQLLLDLKTEQALRKTPPEPGLNEGKPVTRRATEAVRSFQSSVPGNRCQPWDERKTGRLAASHLVLQEDRIYGPDGLRFHN